MGLLVRCLRGLEVAGAPPRLALGLVSARASTGRLAAELVRGLGLWVGAGGGRKNLRSCVGGPRVLRLLPDPVANAEAFNFPRVNEESWLPLGVGWAALLPSRGTVHEKGEPLPRLTPPSVDLQPQNGSCGCRSTDRTRKRRTVARERGKEESWVTPRPQPDPETRSRGRARCRSRPFRRPDPARAEAAHQQAQTPAGSAPARSRQPQPTRQQGHDDGSQRASNPTPPAGSAPAGPSPPRKHTKPRRIHRARCTIGG